jgi:hypothetical protein
MVRKLVLILATVAALVASVAVVLASPAGANTNITATSVALNEGAGCTTDADLDLGLNAVTVDAEFGLVTNLGGPIGGFDPQGSSFSGFDGVYTGYGQPIEDDQIEGTIIGTYAWVGTEPPTSADTAEWFILYRCNDADGASEVLYSCFGDFGTCPQTAASAVALLFNGTVDDTTPDPGQTITVSAEGCFYPLGGAVLLRDGTGLGGDSVEPDPDGTFSIELTVPADVPPGTPLVAQIDCGNDGATVLSVDVDLTVADDASTTTTTAAPATTTPAAQATPRFTG